MFFSKLPGLFAPDLSFDLGTTNTHVCVAGRGVVLTEPSVLAVKKGTTEVLCDGEAVGSMAKDMIGRTPLSIDAVQPMRDGVVSDFDMTEALLECLIRRAQNGGRWLGRFSPRVLIAVPSAMNAIGKRAVFNAAERAGARRVYLVEAPRAAGLGAGVPIHEASAHMIVDIGGGTTDISILSLADVVVSRSLQVAGDAMDDAIIQYVRKRYNNLIGRNTAEKIKIALGSACQLVAGEDPEEDAGGERDYGVEPSMTIHGRDLIAGLPRAVTVTASDIRAALSGPIERIVEGVREVLERTGPELSGDLLTNGMMLCGGGVLLRGLPELLAEETGLHVEVAEDPITTVARGTSVFLDRLDEFKGILESADDEL